MPKTTNNAEEDEKQNDEKIYQNFELSVFFYKKQYLFLLYNIILFKLRHDNKFSAL